MLGLIAAGVGALSAGAKVIGGNKAAKRSGRLIRDAYEIAQTRLGNHQLDVRQGSLESLNARGVLNAGAMPTAASPDRFGYEGQQGQTGAVGTLGGQNQADLSKEFGLERRDLWNQRQAGIAGVKAEHRAANVGAVASGAQTGLSIYDAFAKPGGGGDLSPQDQATVSAPATLGATGDMQTGPAVTPSIRGAFGLSPIDGTGTPQITAQGQSNYDFHV